jgi:hypothetical protein
MSPNAFGRSPDAANIPYIAPFVKGYQADNIERIDFRAFEPALHLL